MSEVEIITNSENEKFDIYSKLWNADYSILIETERNVFLTDKIPTEIKGNYYFKNCKIHLISGKRIDDDYIGGDVKKIEISKNFKGFSSYKNIMKSFGGDGEQQTKTSD